MHAQTGTAMIVPDKVDNPAEYAERAVHPKIEVVRSLKHDLIRRLYERGHLGRKCTAEGIAEARLDRARLFQDAYERTGWGMIRAVDYLSTGGSDPARRSGLTDRQKWAVQALRDWEQKIGQSGYRLLLLVLIDGCEINEAARRRHGMATKATITFTGHRLRECLDSL